MATLFVKCIAFLLYFCMLCRCQATQTKDSKSAVSQTHENKFLDNYALKTVPDLKANIAEVKNSTQMLGSAKSFTEDQHLDKVSIQQIYKFLNEFASVDFGGKWKFKNLEDIHKINQNFESIEGKARFKFQISSFTGVYNVSFFEFTLILYDGSYINQNIELSSKFQITQGFSDGLLELNQIVKVETGKLFSRPSQSQVKCDIRIKLSKDESNEVKNAILSLSSFEDKNYNFSIEFSNPYNSKISGWRIFIYSTVLFGICLIFVNELIVQTKKAEESRVCAERISLFTLSWNTIWNIWLFNIHSTYALNDGHYSSLVLPSVMYFIICIIFEITLLHICWRARNSALFQENPEEIRRQIILFYLKFYIAYIVAISLSDFMFSNSFLLVIINGLVWVPQIIENVQNKSRNVPTAFIFCFILSFSQGFMPAYFLLFDSNIFEIKSSSFWGLSLLFMHCASLLILQCQRWFGARFFIPKYLRSRSSYQYHDLFEDPEGDTDKDCAICLNNLSDDHGLNQNHRDQYSNQYMRTPCGHNFHPSCLKTWMNQKLECPSCRSPIPALDSDDEEDN